MPTSPQRGPGAGFAAALVEVSDSMVAFLFHAFSLRGASCKCLLSFQIVLQPVNDPPRGASNAWHLSNASSIEFSQGRSLEIELDIIGAIVESSLTEQQRIGPAARGRPQDRQDQANVASAWSTASHGLRNHKSRPRGVVKRVFRYWG